jgi:restriction system protein
MARRSRTPSRSRQQRANSESGWEYTRVSEGLLAPYESVFEQPKFPAYPSPPNPIVELRSMLEIGDAYVRSLPDCAFELNEDKSVPPTISGAPKKPAPETREPEYAAIPPEVSPPQWSTYVPTPSLIDRILFWRAAAAKRAAANAYWSAHAVWEAADSGRQSVLERNRKKAVAHEAATAKAREAIERWERKFAMYRRRVASLEEVFEAHQRHVQSAREADRYRVKKVREDYAEGDPSAYFAQVLRRSPYPRFMALNPRCDFRSDSGILVATIDLPDFTGIIEAAAEAMKSRYDKPAIPPKSERKRLAEDAVPATLVRGLYELATSDAARRAGVIAINGRMRWNDPISGQPRYEIVASVQCDPEVVRAFSLAQLNPRESFKALKGAQSPGLTSGQLSPVLPVLEIQADGRIVENRDVLSASAAGADLLELTWEDFEHLVRELFAKEFASTGARVDVTRASRDWGVDAIIQDPDPIRGGKFVVQAKHYSKLVGVDSVRDLYGTVVNEGANRGIIVTTSHFGPQSYEFAKNKPLTLIDGAGLLGLLEKHGYRYTISS